MMRLHVPIALGGLALLLAPLSAAAQSTAPDAPVETAPPAHTLEELVTLRAEGHFEQVLSRLTALKKQYPASAGVLWRRALILTDLGKMAPKEEASVSYYHRALRDANAALDADSAAAWPHAVKALVEGRLCLHSDKRERARRSERVHHHAERALAHDSTLALAHHMLGRWHRRIADLNYFERTAAKMIYDALPDASFAASVRALRRALKIQKRSYHHLHLGKTYLRMEQEAAARRQFRKALTASGSPLDPAFQSEARSLLEEID